jgi:hypothetical protein
VAGRLARDVIAADAFSCRLGPTPPEAMAAAARLKELRTQIMPTVKADETWHAANPTGKSLGMYNEQAGSRMAGWAGDQWD